jgi:outer membrane protein
VVWGRLGLALNRWKVLEVYVKRNQTLLVGALCAMAIALSMVSTALAAEDFKRWSMGIHALYINPDTDTTGALGNIDVEANLAPGITLEYFFTPYISTELVAAISKHDVEIDNDVYGSLWLLPPSLYLKYHPMPQAKISPFIGAGVNYVFAWDEKLDVNSTFEVEDSFGWAAKAGADIRLNENLFLTAEAMYYQIETEFSLRDLGVNDEDIDLDSWIFSLGAKYRF